MFEFVQIDRAVAFSTALKHVNQSKLCPDREDYSSVTTAGGSHTPPRLHPRQLETAAPVHQHRHVPHRHSHTPQRRVPRPLLLRQQDHQCQDLHGYGTRQVLQ